MALLAGKGVVPLAAFAMGAAGLPSRILALAWGSHFTYLGANQGVAPGQLTYRWFIGTYTEKGARAAHSAVTGLSESNLLDLAAKANQRLKRLTPQAPLLVPYHTLARSERELLFRDLGAQALFEIAESGADTYSVDLLDSATNRKSRFIAKGMETLAAVVSRYIESGGRT